MKIIITGANGFLGKNLCHDLLKNGHEVICMVRKSSGFENEIVSDLDLISAHDLKEILSSADCVIHLAALADFRADFAPEIYQTNCLTTIKFINVCKQLAVHFVFASNALIVGTEVSIINKDTQDNPNIPYNIAKYICECLIEKELQSYAILRIGGIYGLFGPEHLYLNKAISNALLNDIAPTINGTGEALRNYIFVKDLATYIRILAEHKTNGKILIGGPDIKPIKYILEMVAQICNHSVKEVAHRNVDAKSFDQVIEGSLPHIHLHTYEEALMDIKADFQQIKK